MKPLSEASTAELLAAQAKGRRTLNALNMADLADHRQAAHYEPYAPDSFDQLDRNFAQIQRLQTALKNVADELARRETIA